MRKLLLAGLLSMAVTLTFTSKVGAQTASGQPNIECDPSAAAAQCNQMNGLLGTGILSLLIGIIALFMFLNRPVKAKDADSSEQEQTHTQ